MTMSWNFGDIFDTVTEAVAPGSPALIHGERVIGWDELARRSNYVETTIGCMKAGLVHVNVNFRYGPEEVRYIIDNADAAFVVFAGEFAGLLDGIRGRLPQVRGWFQVDDGTPAAAFAEPYERLVTGNGARPDVARSADDLLFLYTGGTTGMPKGVMWRAEDPWQAIGGGG